MHIKIGLSILTDLVHPFRHICHCCEACSRLWFSAAYCEISVPTITNMKTDIKVQIEPSSICIKCFLCQKKIYPTRQPHNIPDSKPLCQKGSLSNQRAEHLTNHQFQPKERNLSRKHRIMSTSSQRLTIILKSCLQNPVLYKAYE